MVQWTTLHVSIRPLVTVVETPECLARIDRLMTEEEREQLIAYLAANPTEGDLIPGTGGVRKLRWGLAGRGKRGGASQHDRNDLRGLTKLLVDTYRRTRP